MVHINPIYLRQRVFLSFLAALLLSSEAHRVRASVSFQYVAGQGTYATTEGSTIGVPIYLQETLSAGSTSLITAGNGLFSGGFALTLQNGSTAGIGSLAGSTASFPGGSFVMDSTTAGSTSFQRGDNIADNLTGPSGEPNGSGLVLLGTAYIQASSVSAGVATFSVGAYSPGNGGYTQTFTAPTAPYYYDLDLTNNGTASGPPTYNAAASSSFEVVTVAPEPTFIGCWGGGLAASLALRRRGRRCLRSAVGVSLFRASMMPPTSFSRTSGRAVLRHVAI